MRNFLISAHSRSPFGRHVWFPDRLMLPRATGIGRKPIFETDPPPIGAKGACVRPSQPRMVGARGPRPCSDAIDLLGQVRSANELPMATVIILAAKTRHTQLLARVEAGEEIALARGKRPIARLVPYRPPMPKRTFGALRGIVSVDPGFFRSPARGRARRVGAIGLASIARHPRVSLVGCRGYRASIAFAAAQCMTSPPLGDRHAPT